MRSIRTVASLLVVCALASATITMSPSRVAAADLAQFDPGMIITDALFYNGNSLSEQQVQQVLTARGGPCRSGYTCLSGYSEVTTDRAGDSRCSAYSSPGLETAAQIIRHVGAVCNVSQKALVVLLQKEQGLVTSTGPSASMYRSATGYGCPDTAACDTRYYGFFNQVYNAAHQFQVYRTSPRSFRYQPGAWNAVLFSPNSSCGSSQVYIQNAATAGLYDYTPYQPNAAALRAGYGVGDGCSTYGNRNFFSYYTDWFGSTKRTVVGWIGDRYAALGAGWSVLGEPIENEQAAPGGASQSFEGGAVYCSAAGAFVLRGWILDAYRASGAWGSALGWPLSDERSLGPAGAIQTFQNGVLISSAAGAFLVPRPFDSLYADPDTAIARLGYPTGAVSTAGDGSASLPFERATAVAANGGVQIISGWIRDEYASLGADQRALLGAPTTAEVGAPSGGAMQSFRNGTIYSSAAGAHTVIGAADTSYRAHGGPGGVLGYPVADLTVQNGLPMQRFANGDLYTTAQGTWALRGWIRDRWAAEGGVSGKLGAPASDEASVASGASQQFAGGAIYSSSAGAWAAAGWSGDAYRAAGGPSGPLGFPLGDEYPTSAGDIRQSFENGFIVTTAAGAFPVRGWIGDAWARSGSTSGLLGAPVSSESPVPGGAMQLFAGGRIWSSPAGAFATRGWIGDAYLAMNGSAGLLGSPTSDEQPLPNGAVQTFAGGVAVSSSAGAFAVRGSIGITYAGLGGARGPLGVPLGNERRVSADYVQDFTNGTIIIDSQGVAKVLSR